MSEKVYESDVERVRLFQEEIARRLDDLIGEGQLLAVHVGALLDCGDTGTVTFERTVAVEESCAVLLKEWLREGAMLDMPAPAPSSDAQN